MSEWADSIDRFRGGPADPDSVLIPAFIGSLAALAGSFVTWATIPSAIRSVDVDGIKGDGRVTVVLAWIALVLLFRHAWRTVAVFAAAGVSLASVDVTNTARRVASTNATEASSATVGYGLWVCLTGFAITLLAALWATWYATRASDSDDWATDPTN